MSRSLLPVRVESYVNGATREPPILQQLRAETSRLPEAGMQIGPDQAAFMQLLVRVTGARRCLEIGTFTGYSALAVALALPEDGTLVTCDISDEFTRMARRYWAQAGVESRISLRLSPALDTLDQLLAEGGARFDFAFIDADKLLYPQYYDRCVRLARPGGLILLDNMLWSGKVADPAEHDPETAVLRDLNQRIREDTRVDAVLLTIGDGLTMVRVR